MIINIGVILVTTLIIGRILPTLIGTGTPLEMIVRGSIYVLTVAIVVGACSRR